MQEPSKKVLSNPAYEHPVSTVRKMLADDAKAGREADSSKAVIYWGIGNVLLENGLTGRDHYGESILEQLADDLEINAQTIRRAIVFRRVYGREDLYRSVKVLTWSHYRLCYA